MSTTRFLFLVIATVSDPGVPGDGGMPFRQIDTPLQSLDFVPAEGHESPIASNHSAGRPCTALTLDFEYSAAFNMDIATPDPVLASRFFLSAGTGDPPVGDFHFESCLRCAEEVRHSLGAPGELGTPGESSVTPPANSQSPTVYKLGPPSVYKLGDIRPFPSRQGDRENGQDDPSIEFAKHRCESWKPKIAGLDAELTVERISTDRVNLKFIEHFRRGETGPNAVIRVYGAQTTKPIAEFHDATTTREWSVNGSAWTETTIRLELGEEIQVEVSVGDASDRWPFRP